MKFLHFISRFQWLDIGHEVRNQSEVEIWIIKMHDLPVVNEILNKRVEITQIGLEILDVGLLSFCHS